MKVCELQKIMNKLDIQEFSVAEVGSVSGLEEVYEYRKSGGALTGLEPDGIFRSSPDKLLENGKTIIAIAIPYEIKNSYEPTSMRGFVTNMAWEFDYHKAVGERMEKIKAAILEVHPEGKFLSAVDTGPVNDRMAAYGARLGWIGRNQFLINKKHGTGFYIGILITDIEFEDKQSWRYDYELRCGSCRKCQQACPANALTGVQDFNGQRCISTLTQLKRDLSYDECLSIGTNIYGCDICQWVCPHNKNTVDMALEFKRHSANRLEPRQILELSNKQFKKEYGYMGFAWRGLAVLKRNALISMGNDGCLDDWEYIFDIIHDLQPKYYRYAIWALFEIDMDRTMEELPNLHDGDENKIGIIKENLAWKMPTLSSGRALEALHSKKYTFEYFII